MKGSQRSPDERAPSAPLLHLHRLPVLGLATFWAVLLMVLPAAARAEGADEAQLMAAYLVNFLKYVEWPADTGGATICLYGRERLAAPLRAYEGRSILGREIRIRHVTQAYQLAECQQLFIAEADEEQVATLFKSIGRQAVLTIGDTPSFALQGGGITLLRVDNRLVFDVNLAAIHRAGLKINPQMLRLAREVTGGPR